MAPWLPAASGITAVLIITATMRLSAKRTARAAMDELYRSQNRRAQAIAYWFALALYPCFIPSTVLALTLAQVLGVSVHDIFELDPEP